uniref:Peptidase S74 domain-containing protein n=1 Tax=viral metagenome TaxID=1070528 RepID=A0A6C0CRI8_9ZZZZ
MNLQLIKTIIYILKFYFSITFPCVKVEVSLDMLNLQSSAYNIRSGGEGQYEFFSDISTRSLLSVRVGESAGKISTGSGNAFIGYESGKQNIEGSFGTFVGFQAGSLNQYGNYCTYVGAFAGLQNRNGDANTFVGYRAGELNKDGSECVGVGAYTLRENTSGSRIVAVGYRAAERTLDGDFNTMVGAESGQDNRSGNFNTMAGFRSGRASFRGNENTYFGAYAGYSNSLGNGNAFIGYKAGEYLQDGGFNVAVGAYALQRAEHGDCNIAIGAYAGSVATGSGSIYVGTNAGASNVNGDYNVYLGSDTGALANGNENVYIGKSAACNLQGNQNVVIGAYTLLDRQTNGSVVIGYRIGENFQTGNSNVFIGYGVDTHDTANSFGIAIGTQNVKTYHNAIAVGKDINNSGNAGIILGGNILCDAENTISIGHDIDVSSVYVLADRLDYRFPLNTSKTYDFFNLQESYTDTLFDGIRSNTSAIFALNTSNIYNSGDNRVPIPIIRFDSNLLSLFYSHILYQGKVLPLYTAPTTLSNLTIEVNMSSNIRIQNGLGLPLIPSSNEIFASEQKKLYQYPITIHFTGHPYTVSPSLLINKLGTLGINLVKKDEDIGQSNQFIYSYYFPKRYPIYSLQQNGYQSNIEMPLRYEYIRQASNVESWNFNLWNYETSADGYDTGLYGSYPTNQEVLSNIVLQQPHYGLLTSNLYTYSPTITYTPFPESLFATQDQFTIYPARQIDQQLLLSDRSNVITMYSSNIERFNSNVVFLHPYQDTTIDRSYLLRKPLYDPSTSVQWTIGTNMTLKNNHIAYVTNPVITTYQDVIDQSITLCITDSNISIDEQLQVTIGTDDYPLSVFYVNTSNYINDYATSNITVSLATSNVLTSTALPSLFTNEIYVRQYPTYGMLTVPETAINTNEIIYQSYHPTKQDQCQLLVQTSNGDRQDYRLLNYTFIRNNPNTYFSIPLYKTQYSAYTLSGVITQLVLLNIDQQNQSLQTFIIDTSTVSVTNAGGSIPPSIPSSSISYTCNVTSYVPNLQYLETCNIINKYNFNKISYAGLSIADKNKLPLPSPWDGQACNIYYYKYTSENPLTYPATTGSYNINIVNRDYAQTYSLYFYGDNSPYYEYETITGVTNVYWEYRKQITHESFYDYASNLFIQTSNIVYESSRYYSAEDQTALYFDCNIQIPITYPYTSNLRLSTLSGDSIYKIYTSNFAYYFETAKYINAYPLYDKNLYQYNANYQYQQTNSNISIVQRDVGIITQFNQSNLTQGDVYLWVTSNLTSNQPYEFHRIQFNNNRHIDLNYYSNVATPTSLDQSFAFQTSNFVSQTLDGTQVSPAYNFANEANTFIGIQSSKDGVLVHKNTKEITNKIDYTQVAEYQFIPLTRSNIDSIQYFYVDKTTNPYKARSLISKPIRIDSRIQNPIYLNQSIQDIRNKITANHSYITYNELYPNEIVYRILSHSNDFNQTQFSQKDIQDEVIYLTTSNISGRYTIDYDLINSLTGNAFSQGSFLIENYKQTIYPAIQYGQTSCNELNQIQSLYGHHLNGDVWSYLNQAFQPTIYNSNELYIHIIRSPSKGYLYSSNSALTQSTNVRQRFTYEEFKNDKIHYIPYTPMELSNDSYQLYLEYRGDVSDVYTTTIKNYWSRFSPFLVDTGRVINDTYQIKLNTIPRSAGLIQDGYQWSSNGNTLSIKDYTVPKVIEYSHFTQRPYFNTSNVQKTLDNGGFYNFSDLTEYVVSSNSRDLHFFISSNPIYGCILKEAIPFNSNFKYVADPYFTYTDIVQRKIFYHHTGENNVTDQFSLIVGSLKGLTDSNIYDVSQQSLTYTIDIQTKPQLILNNPDYVYKLTMSNILNDYNLLTTSIIDITSGNINIYQSSNIELYRKDNGSYLPSSFFTKNELSTNKVYYQFNSNVFQNNSNQNQPNDLQFIVSSQSNVSDYIDPLSTLPYYNGLYLQTWQSYLNQYISSNEIVYPLTSNQVVQYSKRSFDPEYVSFDGRRVEIDFTLNPDQQQLYVSSVSDTFPHSVYLDPITNLAFDFKIQDQNDINLFQARFTKKTVTLYNSSNIAYGPIPITVEMDRNNLFQVILKDDRNNNGVSLYINNTNYLANIQYDPLIPSASNIKTFLLQANIEDSKNYYNYVLTSNLNSNVYLYYNLTNLTNRLLFNDFNILVNTYDQASRENVGFNASTAASNYNVIIGKVLDVKGLNNICIGRNFKTVGTDSIILGNNIGVNEIITANNTLNEIFDSIVIANNSFINSKVRDTIAIGNNILSNIDPTLVDMNNFLRKRPVLIGNDITTDLIDFHINFQNTILKTTEGPVGGIYLGLNQEVVGIGYTQNQQFTNEYQLYVNGGISTRGPFTIGGELVTLRKLYGNLIYTSGINHSLTIPISWTTTQTDDYSAFLVTGKFRGLLNDTETLYRRFETWVTPKDDLANSKPKGLVDYEVANYNTGGISGFGHTLTRNTATTINLTISWTTNITLTILLKMIVHLDLEVSYPETIGKIILGTTIFA